MSCRGSNKDIRKHLTVNETGNLTELRFNAGFSRIDDWPNIYYNKTVEVRIEIFGLIALDVDAFSAIF